MGLSCRQRMGSYQGAAPFARCIKGPANLMPTQPSLGFWGCAVSGFWGLGVLGFWAFGVLGFWGFEVLGFWGFRVLGF